MLLTASAIAQEQQHAYSEYTRSLAEQKNGQAEEHKMLHQIQRCRGREHTPLTSCDHLFG